MKRWATVLGSLVLLQPLSGLAAPGTWLADDFETGTLVSEDLPPGRWDQAVATSPNTVVNGAQGAHRGRRGLTVTDSSSAQGPVVSLVQDADTLTSEVHARTWLRLRAVSAYGRIILAQAMPALVELRLVEQDAGAVWELAARNGPHPSPTYVSRRGSPVEPERWYLVEFSARGLGTASGEARLWVDGVEQVAPLSGRDWSHPEYEFDTFILGEPWTDTGTFRGSIDYDDVRVSAAPHASRLELRPPVEAPSSCLAVDVSLRSTAAQAPAPAPYDTDVALAVTAGEGGFHADAQCDSPVTGTRLPVGTTERRVYFRPTGGEGVATLAASHPDFLSATVTVEGLVASDDDEEEDDDGAGPWTAGCTSAPGALVALPLLVRPGSVAGAGRRSGADVARADARLLHAPRRHRHGALPAVLLSHGSPARPALRVPEAGRAVTGSG
ncbi:hypothetical protein ACLESD_43205 [Pyxidicoccus sp. 3LFB2]